MKKYIKYVSILPCLLIGGTSFGSDFTLNIHAEGRAASKQYCYTDFEVDTNGNWTARSKYSNGHHVESIRLYSSIIIRSKDGRDVISIPQNHHVKGSFGGSATEERTALSGKLPQDIALQIDKTNVGYACRKVSDFDMRNLQQTVEVARWVMALF